MLTQLQSRNIQGLVSGVVLFFSYAQCMNPGANPAAANSFATMNTRLSSPLHSPSSTARVTIPAVDFDLFPSSPPSILSPIHTPKRKVEETDEEAKSKKKTVTESEEPIEVWQLDRLKKARQECFDGFNAQSDHLRNRLNFKDSEEKRSTMLASSVQILTGYLNNLSDVLEKEKENVRSEKALNFIAQTKKEITFFKELVREFSRFYHNPPLPDSKSKGV